jgi:hypothetical protein
MTTFCIAFYESDLPTERGYGLEKLQKEKISEDVRAKN